MATLLLSTAGAAVGALFGPIGAILGRAAGAIAGYALDQSLFGEDRVVTGHRLSDLDVQTSREGAPIPRVYGRVRIAGEMIWATRFEEEVSETEEGGGKGGSGGTTVKTYRYFANFALALSEGPIARVGRVWADGKPFNLAAVEHRVHRGTESQSPDSLIEAKQGEGRAPAYRGTAYIVFERLALEAFGNRIPQFSFEVIRPVGRLEKKVTAVTLIPGATEFGYDPKTVREVVAAGKERKLNRHQDGAGTDWNASLDELQALCPNLESVSLVVAWFGDDLRAGHCALEPGVTTRDLVTKPDTWSAAGRTRATARLVSHHDGKPAYGGTPSDASVIRAIRDLSDRGLAVMLSPFVMMDIAADNALPSPYGGSGQAAYPWRGLITGSKAPGEPGTPDKTAAAAAEIADFVGTAVPGDFAIVGDTVVYSGPDEWSFRRQILHYAHLAKAAGGVDAFLIGSELRGLTTLRSSGSAYPFVSALVALAADVRDVLGPSVKLSYAADWSEYFGHQPADGSGDVFFHLDPLWASGDIDFVGIDNYLPLADWRDGSVHLDAADWDTGRDEAYLRANIAAGEYFDWYYASGAARAAQTRTPITDGAYGKPWVFRPKDIVGWWSHTHVNRPGGVEAGGPTAWVPEGKPIWFTEAGCPAVDKGANQPNVFPDPKSDSSGLPHFSSGVRDDLIQRRFVGATLGYWDPDDAGYVAGSNPVSAVYGGRMVRPDRTHLWTWDARPFPAFPYRTDVWSDGGNWTAGHWLTGRLGATPGDDLVKQILADYGVTGAAIEDFDGMIDGYVIDSVVSARRALEPLSALLLFEAFEAGSGLRFVKRGRQSMAAFGDGDLADDGDRPLLGVKRAEETELPAEIGIGFADTLADFRASAVGSRRLVTGSRRIEARDTGAAMSHAVAGGLADAMLMDIWAGRETVRFALPRKRLDLEPADVCDIVAGGTVRTVLVTRIDDGEVRRIEARSLDPDVLSPVPEAERATLPEPEPDASPPDVLLLDLPLLSGAEPPHAPRIAAFADPWPGAVAVAIGTAASGFAARQSVERRATVGVLTEALPAGPLWRFDRANRVTVRLSGGTLAALPEAAVLNGGNAAAIGSAATGYEVLQFLNATLIAPDTYELDGLLRGQGGTGDIAAAGHPTGVRFVLLDRAVTPLGVSEAESVLGLTARCGPAGAVYDPEVFVDVTVPAGRRGLRCLAPVAIAARRDAGSGDVTITWIRQTRIGGDAFEPVAVPLGEASEAYRVDILDGPTVVRTFAVAVPTALYTNAEQTADFGSLPASLHIRVSQVSPTEGPGSAGERTIDV